MRRQDMRCIEQIKSLDSSLKKRVVYPFNAYIYQLPAMLCS